jgi:chaperonin cofactor prefoldin
MRMKVVYTLFSIACLSALFLGTANASESPVRTCQYIWGDSTPRRMYINLTAPMYAAPGSLIQMSVVWFFETAIAISAPGQQLEVYALRNSGVWQQIFFSVALPDGNYAAGTQRNITAYVPVPSDARLGSLLNVSLYMPYNAWMPYPTEIRGMNYDDLQSAYDNLQSQVYSLNQQVSSLTAQVYNLTQQLGSLPSQVANLTAEKDALNQQVANLTSDKNTLSQQVASLNNQVADLNSKLTNQTYIVIAAAAVAALTIGSAVYLAVRRRQPAQPPS